jgi:hypothetical protein
VRFKACYLSDDNLKALAARAEALREIRAGDLPELLATDGESSWPYAVTALWSGVGPDQTITPNPFDLPGEAS